MQCSEQYLAKCWALSAVQVRAQLWSNFAELINRIRPGGYRKCIDGRRLQLGLLPSSVAQDARALRRWLPSTRLLFGEAVRKK
jgi:hypothetical protein